MIPTLGTIVFYSLICLLDDVQNHRSPTTIEAYPKGYGQLRISIQTGHYYCTVQPLFPAFIKAEYYCKVSFTWIWKVKSSSVLLPFSKLRSCHELCLFPLTKRTLPGFFFASISSVTFAHDSCCSSFFPKVKTPLESLQNELFSNLWQTHTMAGFCLVDSLDFNT